MKFTEEELYLAKDYFARVSYFLLKYDWKDFIDPETEGDLLKVYLFMRLYNDMISTKSFTL